MFEEKRTVFWKIRVIGDVLRRGQISLELERHLYTDAKSVSEWVKDTFGIAYTQAGMVDLLNPNRLYLQEDYGGSL